MMKKKGTKHIYTKPATECMLIESMSILAGTNFKEVNQNGGPGIWNGESVDPKDALGRGHDFSPASDIWED